MLEALLRVSRAGVRRAPGATIAGGGGRGRPRRLCGEVTRDEDRNAVHVQRLYAQKLGKMTGSNPRQCRRCWHESKACICPSQISPVSALFPHRIVVYMHVKEFGRGSNTSSLCRVAFPSNSSVLVASVPDDEREFARELAVRPDRTIVLYPTADSITVSQFLDMALPAALEKSTPGTGEVGQGDATQPLTIVLVDGTWGQARRLAKRLPASLTRVRLNLPSEKDAFDRRYSSPLRSQPGPERLCTLSALALLTRELSVDARVEKYLLGLLHLKSEVFLSHHDKAWKVF